MFTVSPLFTRCLISRRNYHRDSLETSGNARLAPEREILPSRRPPARHCRLLILPVARSASRRLLDVTRIDIISHVHTHIGPFRSFALSDCHRDDNEGGRAAAATFRQLEGRAGTANYPAFRPRSDRKSGKSG
jgi:hypothetical protein